MWMQTPSCFSPRAASELLLLTYIWMLSQTDGVFHFGCFIDHNDDPEYSMIQTPRDENLTPTRCIQFCRSLSYSYAALKGGNDCACGCSYAKYTATAQQPSDTGYGCTTPCVGDSGQQCGASDKNSVYYTGGHALDTDEVTCIGNEILAKNIQYTAGFAFCSENGIFRAEIVGDRYKNYNVYTNQIIEQYGEIVRAIFQNDKNFCWQKPGEGVNCTFTHTMDVASIHYSNSGEIIGKNNGGQITYTRPGRVPTLQYLGPLWDVDTSTCITYSEAELPLTVRQPLSRCHQTFQVTITGTLDCHHTKVLPYALRADLRGSTCNSELVGLKCESTSPDHCIWNCACQETFCRDFLIKVLRGYGSGFNICGIDIVYD